MGNPYIQIYRGSTTVDDAKDILINNALGSKGFASFNIPNEGLGAYSTWKDLEDQEIWFQLYYNDGGTTPSVLLHKGIIMRIEPKNERLYIQTNGIMEKLTWAVLQEHETKMVWEEGLVKTAIGIGDMYFYGKDEEGNDFVWDNDEWNDYYCIISDATRDTSESGDIVADANGDNGNWSCAVDCSGDYEDTAVADSTYYTMYTTGNKTVDKICWLVMDVAGEGIGTSAQITKIEIDVKAQIEAKTNLIEPNYTLTLDILWSKDSSLNPETTIHLRSYEVTYGDNVWNTTYIDTTDKVSGPMTIESADHANSSLFTTSGANWDGGGIFFRIRAMPETTISGYHECFLKIDYASVKLYYVTDTFDEINAQITDTQSSNMLVTDEVLYGNGIQVNDSFKVVKGADLAFEYVSKTLPIEVNKGSAIDLGLSTDYFGVTAYDLMTALCRELGYTYYTDYEISNAKIYCHRLADASASGITYDKDNDPPTWAFEPTIHSQRYKSVYVFYAGGMVGPIYPTSPDASYEGDREKSLVRKGILTRSRAYALGQEWIDENNKKKYSLNLKWDKLPSNLPKIGQKHTFTDWQDNSFTDVICKGITYSQMTRNSPIIVSAEFGRGATEPVEYIGRRIGTLAQENSLNDGLALTSQYSPVRRHSQLLGVESNDHHTQFENLVEDTSPQLGGNLDMNNFDIVSNLDLTTSDHTYFTINASAASKNAMVLFKSEGNQYASIGLSSVGITELHLTSTGDIMLSPTTEVVDIDARTLNVNSETVGGGNALINIYADLARVSGLYLYENAVNVGYVASPANSDEMRVCATDELYLYADGVSVVKIDAGKMSFTGAGGAINEFSIDGTMAGNSDDAVPTEQAVIEQLKYLEHIGSANSGLMPCIPVSGETAASAALEDNAEYAAGYIGHADTAGQSYTRWNIPLERTKKIGNVTYYLYIASLKWNMYDADGTNRIKVSYLHHFTGNSITSVSNSTAVTATGVSDRDITDTKVGNLDGYYCGCLWYQTTTHSVEAIDLTVEYYYDV